MAQGCFLAAAVGLLLLILMVRCTSALLEDEPIDRCPWGQDTYTGQTCTPTGDE